MNRTFNNGIGMVVVVAPAEAAAVRRHAARARRVGARDRP
jgi:phosphoribosylaminoimidazole (AIR) synthetase